MENSTKQIPSKWTFYQIAYYHRFSRSELMEQKFFSLKNYIKWSHSVLYKMEDDAIFYRSRMWGQRLKNTCIQVTSRNLGVSDCVTRWSISYLSWLFTDRQSFWSKKHTTATEFFTGHRTKKKTSWEWEAYFFFLDDCPLIHHGSHQFVSFFYQKNFLLFLQIWVCVLFFWSGWSPFSLSDSDSICFWYNSSLLMPSIHFSPYS